jgi:hypothetical protein
MSIDLFKIFIHLSGGTVKIYHTVCPMRFQVLPDKLKIYRRYPVVRRLSLSLHGLIVWTRPIYFFFSNLSLKTGPAAYSPEQSMVQKIWYIVNRLVKYTMENIFSPVWNRLCPCEKAIDFSISHAAKSFDYYIIYFLWFIFWGVILHHQTKKINSFLKSIYHI